MPRVIQIAKGKNTDLILYPGNSLNRNLLNHNAMNIACLTDFSLSESALTHLPILASLPSGEVVCPPKCLNNFSLTTRSSVESWMFKGLSSPNISRDVLTMSSRVIMSSSTKKKNVWREGDQWGTKCLNPLKLRKPSKFLVLATDFRILACTKHPKKSLSANSLSTQPAQLLILLAMKSKKRGIASRDPCLIWRSNISFGSGTCAELAKPNFLEKVQEWGDEG